LAALQKQHDKAGECHHCQPVVWRFHPECSLKCGVITSYGQLAMMFTRNLSNFDGLELGALP
jgi:hypothetical protein